MAFENEKRNAARLLGALENGNLSLAHTIPLLRAADPALIYFIFAWLRVRYHAGRPASEGVLGRIVGVCSDDSTVAQKARSGETDPIVEWFEETYDYRNFNRDEFVSLIIEKLEG